MSIKTKLNQEVKIEEKKLNVSEEHILIYM